ncbi:hypothetical protein A7K91_17730 [Paenibacillus oryzae]|uniref:Uncharacterized protein n=1 Tax=Paenibacillus oryzae TaxID=1844972 RepID=A0A1A5YDU4_9BACL|nr:hypothetical protein A7K91_17730 [Paenibacillus oryzae]
MRVTGPHLLSKQKTVEKTESEGEMQMDSDQDIKAAMDIFRSDHWKHEAKTSSWKVLLMRTLLRKIV